jgi:hypothetical protein
MRNTPPDPAPGLPPSRSTPALPRPLGAFSLYFRRTQPLHRLGRQARSPHSDTHDPPGREPHCRRPTELRGLPAASSGGSEGKGGVDDGGGGGETAARVARADGRRRALWLGFAGLRLDMMMS